MADDEPAMFTTEWRTLRVEAGDAWLRLAQAPNDHEKVMECAAIAAAHYAAANVRSRPADSTKKGNL